MILFLRRLWCWSRYVGRYYTGPGRDERWSWWEQQKYRFTPRMAWELACLLEDGSTGA